MVTQNVDNLLRQAKSLNPEEREQFLQLLNQQSVPASSKSGDDELAKALASRGILLTVPPKPSPQELERFHSWRPIEMPGPSLSDELVRDRR